MACWGFPQPSAISRQHYPGLLLPGSNSRQPLCQAWGLQSISQPRPSGVRLYLSKQPKQVTAETLVPQRLGQPSRLILVAESPEPRQGFAKKRSGGSSQCRSQHRAAHPRPSPEELCSCQDFWFPLLWPWLKSHSSQIFSTGPLEWAAKPSRAVSIKQFFEIRFLGSVRPPCAVPSSCSTAKLDKDLRFKDSVPMAAPAG